jgi:hypothetical protein
MPCRLTLQFPGHCPSDSRRKEARRSLSRHAAAEVCRLLLRRAVRGAARNSDARASPEETFTSVRARTGIKRELQYSPGPPLPDGHGSVSCCGHAGAIPSRARKQAVLRILQLPLQSAPQAPFHAVMVRVLTARYIHLWSRALPDGYGSVRSCEHDRGISHRHEIRRAET